MDATGTSDETTSRRIGEWAKRLLQLDRRNNLLYFKPGRSAVGITSVSPNELNSRLRRSRRGLEFPYVPPGQRRRRGFNVESDEGSTNTQSVSSGDLETDCEPSDLQRRLRNLQRRDREWKEEQGLNVLFLVFGFLNWVDEDGERARAPLVLIPCDLDRSSPRDPFRLVREDDDATDNPTLRHKLALQGIELPNLQIESAEDDRIEEYINGVSALTEGREDWSVDYDIALGTFSFSKLSMYEDLSRMVEHGARSDLTRVLAGVEIEGGGARFQGAPATPREPELVGGRLDDLLDLRDQYTVLPADFSQLRAIEEARRGENLVIHGPPGTGKSQTIANLIATLIADGKRVLFVSEKTAALDVVKRRLEECNLGAFCLDLHSDRARKSEVYRQLSAAVGDERAQLAVSVPIDELVEQRDRLNRAVRLLHERREPLGMSVRDVQGLFAQYSHYPSLDAFSSPPVSELTGPWIRDAEEVANRIARRPEEFRVHHTSRWIPLRIPQPSLQLADRIRQDMVVVQSAVETLCSKAGPVAKWTGAPAIESAEDGRIVTNLLRLLASGPTVPAAWLTRGATNRLRRMARDQSQQQRARRRLEQTLAEWFGGPPPSVGLVEVAKTIEITPEEREAIEAVAGSGWSTKLGRNPSELLEQVTKFADALDALVSDAGGVAVPLGELDLHTIGQLNQAADLASRILAIDPVPDAWLALSAINRLDFESGEARKLLERLERDEEGLSKDFSDALVDLVDEEMLIRYRADHQSFWRRFGGAYRRDLRMLRGQLKRPGKLSLEESLAAVVLATDVKKLRSEWRDLEPHLRESFGARYLGRDTDWMQINADLAALRDILRDWGGDSDVQRELLVDQSGSGSRRSLDLACQSLQSSLNRYRSAAESIDKAFLAPSLVVMKIGDIARRSLVPLRRVAEATTEIYRRLATRPADFEELQSLIGDGVILQAIVEEDERLAPSLAQDFGGFFQGKNTDWEAVSNALEWTDEFLHAANGRISDVLAGHATTTRASDEFESRSESLFGALSAFSEALSVLDERFDRDILGWPTWDSPPFEDLESWTLDLQKNAGGALLWVEYREAVRELDQHLGTGSSDVLRAATENAEDAPGIVLRTIYASWLGAIYDAEPELRSFSTVDHESVRTKFRELDERFPKAARQRVRERVFAGYPEQYETPLQRGQLGTLKGELSKRRRQMPVRRLIDSIPNLLQALKPCFLMSPLAVSQYLPWDPPASDHLAFDTVIFDEASQVLPEDAVPAIERAQQVIVVGDRLQLPPTNFFRTALGNDDDWDDEEEDQDSFEGRESILDVMVGQVGTGFAERYLNVHYRSRSESLISFSNSAFYDNRLLTFPSPDPADAAVRDVYLPNATYDMGRTRTNREEAERVRDLVFELMASQPLDESFGVVALSRAQADLIETLIEEHRMLNRHLDGRFSHDLPERFFVKNLENVQGDERDHMILSICYGPTPAGGVPNRFGPINLDGGERRLNVAVTRARMSMTVVHSLRAEDITSTQPGARQLRRYLEYVRNPERPFETDVTGLGEPESPFEEAVIAALRRRGHRVDSQIGVSGYRIDLAIKSEGGERYDLGIECDGATYHSSPTARDRDWLRQQVLERLGWAIHRVWSTAWIRDPDAEIAAIERALEQARSDEADPSRTTSGSRVHVEEMLPQSNSTPTVAPQWAQEPAPPPQIFDEYRQYESKVRRGDLLNVPLSELSALVREIIDVEQPVHIDTIIDRVRDTYGAPRAGKRIRDQVEQAIEYILSRPRDRTTQFLQRTKSLEQLRPRREAKRPIDRVAGPEIDEALLLVAKASFGIEQGDLIRETARQFGWRRTGQEIERRLNDRVERLLQQERLELRGNMLIANDNA